MKNINVKEKLKFKSEVNYQECQEYLKHSHKTLPLA